MQLNTQRVEDFASNLDAKSFTVEMNSMMFYSVINGIYADKIRAPMRELATNARDGHALANKLDVPFDIMLPTLFNPVFSVRDYGISMDDETVRGLYSSMFSSSKRDTNEAVGMIGLGSKSPFAYVNTFTVTTWLDGMRRDYVAFIGPDDIPKISMIAETPSDDPQGVEVSFSVRSEDVNIFRSAADQVFFGFDPKPNIKDFTFKKCEIAHEGNGYRLYKAHQSSYPWEDKAMARQGCVIYPLSPSSLNDRLQNNPIWNMPIVIDFPIGQLSVNTSREALGYDQKTVANIEKRVTEVLADMTSIIQNDFDSCPTYLEACKLYSEKLNINVMYKALAGNIKYKGEEIVKHSLACRVISDDHQIRIYPANHRWMANKLANVSFAKIPDSRKKDRPIFTPQEMIDTRVIVDIEDEKLANSVSRVRSVFASQPEDMYARKTIIWLKTETEDKAKEVLRLLGFPDTVYLKGVKPLFLPKNVATSSGTRKKEFLTFYPLSVDIHGELLDISKPLEIDYLYNKGIYFSIYGADDPSIYNRYSMIRRYRAVKQLQNMIETINDKELNELDIYHANSPFLERVSKKKNITMVPISVKLKEAVSRVLDIQEYAEYVEDRDNRPSYQSYDYAHRKLFGYAKDRMEFGKQLPELITEFVKTMKNMEEELEKGNKHPFTKYVSLEPDIKIWFADKFSNLKKINNTPRLSPRAELVRVYSEVMNKYPMIKVVDSQHLFNHYMELVT